MDEEDLSAGATERKPPVSPHLILNPAWLPPAVGFAHAVVPAPGLVVYLGGQAGHKPDGSLAGDSLIQQFDQACGNVVEALAAAGGLPQDLVSIQIFVTDVAEYRASMREVGDVYRRHFGRHYPAESLLEVSGLLDPHSKVELMCVAVIPDRGLETSEG